MDITTLWSIPAHPLFVYLPVVLLPLIGLGGVEATWPRVQINQELSSMP